MNNKGYIGIPIGITLVSEIIFPYLNTLKCDRVWYSPPLNFCILMFLCVSVLLGFTLYEAAKIENDKLYAYCFVLTFLNIIWAYYIFRNEKITILTLFLSLIFAYFCYNTVFLSSLTNDEKYFIFKFIFGLHNLFRVYANCGFRTFKK